MCNNFFDMHIFNIYPILITYTLFTICCANYLTKDIYLKVSFRLSILYIKKIRTYVSDKSLISNHNIVILLELIQLIQLVKIHLMFHNLNITLK